MTSPYPQIDRWAVPESAMTTTLEVVGPAGQQGNESGVFWLGARAGLARVSVVVHPQGEGVEETPGYWRVSPEVFGVISRWAGPLGLTLLGIAHTHGRGVPARLSWADRNRSVRVPGILAVVIGNGGEDHDYRGWGWYVHENGDFRELGEAELMERVEVQVGETVAVWRADNAGVWQLTK
jgi:hypothetical protein